MFPALFVHTDTHTHTPTHPLTRPPANLSPLHHILHRPRGAVVHLPAHSLPHLHALPPSRTHHHRPTHRAPTRQKQTRRLPAIAPSVTVQPRRTRPAPCGLSPGTTNPPPPGSFRSLASRVSPLCHAAFHPATCCWMLAARLVYKVCSLRPTVADLLLARHTVSMILRTTIAEDFNMGRGAYDTTG